MQQLTIDNRRLSTASSRRCQDLPGQRLFQYLDADGRAPSRSTSCDVNDYIRAATGGEFTAKHFRTWGASVLAFKAYDRGGRRQGLKFAQGSMLEPVCAALGNTPAIARKSYVHPALIELAKAPAAALGDAEAAARDASYLSPAERGLIDFLDELAATAAAAAVEDAAEQKKAA